MIMSEWKEIFIDSACSRLSSGKSISSSLIKDKGDYPIYGGNGIRGFTNTYNFDGECAIIGRQGASCGNVRYFSGKAYMTEHAVVAVPTKEHNAYYLSCVLASLKLGRLSGQSAQPGIGVGLIGKQNIIMPSLATQQKIASILSSLDNKIENNRKICANLEAQAQALFKHWFIDFAPFKDGKFVESELGMIPEGWRVGTLSCLGDIIGGATPSKSVESNYCQDGIHWLTPKDLSKNCLKFTSRGEIDITLEGYTSCSAKIMPRGSVLFSSRAPIGYLTIAKNEICTNQGFKSIVPRYAGTAYLYYLLKYNTKRIESMASGTTFKEASGSLMKSLPVIIPTKSYLIKFETCVKDLFDEQELLESQISRLSTLRDTLLPKLMSGAIKV